MAINPMIAMSGQPVNANAAIQGGLQTAQQIRQMPIQAALDKQRVQAGQQSLQQGQQQLQIGDQTIQQNTNALQNARGSYMHQLATALTKLPLEQRAGAVARALPTMQQLGISRDQALSQDLSDQALGQVIAATRPFAQTPGSDQTAGMKDFQFYQSVINDPNSTPEQKRSARIALGLEANEGRTQLIDTGVPGVYQTFDPNTNQMSVPMKRDDQGNLIPLTRQEQLDLNLNEEGRRIRSRGEAEEEVQASLAETLADIEIAKERRQTLTGNQVARMEGAIQSGISAAGSLPGINRGLELLKKVDTGGMTATAKVFTDFFGTTNPDIGELNRNLAQNVLDGLSNFEGAISEGERAFLESIEANLSQGTAVNVRELERMRNIYVREMKKAKKAAELSEDEYALDVINSALTEQAGVNPQQGGTQDIDELLNLYAPQQ